MAKSEGFASSLEDGDILSLALDLRSRKLHESGRNMGPRSFNREAILIQLKNEIDNIAHRFTEGL